MEKGDSLSLRPYARRVVDQPDTFGPAAGEGVIQIVNRKADVMNAWTATVDEPGDRRIGGVGLE